MLSNTGKVKKKKKKRNNCHNKVVTILCSFSLFLLLAVSGHLALSSLPAEKKGEDQVRLRFNSMRRKGVGSVVAVGGERGGESRKES